MLSLSNEANGRTSYSTLIAVSGILGEIFGFRHDDRDGFTLQVQFLRQWIGHWSALWWAA